MDYNKHYNALIERARDRNLNVYVERHHIVPKCMGGSNDPLNIVRLTPEEHYVAHQLLTKMYPLHSGLVYALSMLTGKKIGHPRNTNKMYGWIRRKIAETRKKQIVSEETRRKLSERIFTSKHRKNIGKSKIGKKYSLGLKRSAETRAKISASKFGLPSPNKGRPMSEEQKQKLKKPKTEAHKEKLREANLKPDVRSFLSNLNKGKSKTEEQKQKQSEAMRGKFLGIPRSEETKRKISETKRAYYAKNKTN